MQPPHINVSRLPIESARNSSAPTIVRSLLKRQICVDSVSSWKCPYLRTIFMSQTPGQLGRELSSCGVATQFLNACTPPSPTHTYTHTHLHTHTHTHAHKHRHTLSLSFTHTRTHIHTHTHKHAHTHSYPSIIGYLWGGYD